ncbi:MAG TPA: hypothetical protein VL325_00345 [Pyrinomonadaceae bacterium]|nr:hypothetical protein [Pyrinomonadaceae bacterium]
MVESQIPHTDLRETIDKHFEWLLVRENGKTFPVRCNEIDVARVDDRTHFSFLDDLGFHTWRLNNVEHSNGEIVLDVAGAFGKNRETLRLVPREPAAALAAEVELARLKKANEIAELIKAGEPGTKIVRVALSAENGRLAHIFYRTGVRNLCAAMVDVSGTMTHEALLAAAILWQQRLALRKKEPVGEVYIAAEKRSAKNLQKLLALLTVGVQSSLKLFEIKRTTEPPEIVELPAKNVRDLWRERPRKLSLPHIPFPSEAAQRIIDLSPEKIDVIYSKQGETLRFLGLPFARVRSMLGTEKAWFGTEKEKRVLNDASWQPLVELIEDLENHRRPHAANKRHELYRASPEAWLEAILRQNIRLLDANLILSPIYNQFRASSDKIDLLALRRDGRLVIIELKTTPDREAVFQAADYWRKIELQRRSGNLRAIRAFGDADILDKPALVYIAAPALSFHRDFEFFAKMLAPEIEMWRWELHEKWREKIKVITRRDYRLVS